MYKCEEDVYKYMCVHVYYKLICEKRNGPVIKVGGSGDESRWRCGTESLLILREEKEKARTNKSLLVSLL